MFTNFLAVTSAQQSPFLNTQDTERPTPKMSVFAVPYPNFSTQSYSRAPASKPEHNDDSSTFIPSSLSKLSLSLSEPFRRYFTASNASVISDPSLRISETDNESSTSLSTVTTGSGPSSHVESVHERELEPVLPLPTYTPIRNAPKPSPPPSYEVSMAASLPRRPETSATRGEDVSFMSSYAIESEMGYHSGYVGESWAGSKREVERLAQEDKEKEDDDGCWCTKWWVIPASAVSMPWVAYYVII